MTVDLYYIDATTSGGVNGVVVHPSYRSVEAALTAACKMLDDRNPEWAEVQIVNSANDIVMDKASVRRFCFQAKGSH